MEKQHFILFNGLHQNWLQIILDIVLDGITTYYIF